MLPKGMSTQQKSVGMRKQTAEALTMKNHVQYYDTEQP